MSSTLITGITELITNDPDTEVPPDPALIVTDGRVSWIGSADRAPAADTALPAEGTVLPAFVDSHSHLVFDGDRSVEFTARMIGARYDGGGIATTVEATRAATDERLRALVEARVAEMRRQGTGVVEIKSGYGLNTPDELRSLRIAAEFTSEVTFLGAHVVPVEYRSDRAGYVDFVIGEMLQRAAEYARWIDVFCEPNSPHAFTGEESREILLAGRAAGLELRVHGNQLGHGPGAQLAVELDAASVDHCTYLSDADIDALVGSATVATVLPGVEFSTHSPYPDARKLIDSGVTVAIASDCNPGTCYSTSIPFMISLAVREMGMTPTEAVWAATRGSALSLRRDDLGVIKVGSPAELTVLDAPNHLHLAYRPGVPLARRLL